MRFYNAPLYLAAERGLMSWECKIGSRRILSKGRHVLLGLVSTCRVLSCLVASSPALYCRDVLGMLPATLSRNIRKLSSTTTPICTFCRSKSRTTQPPLLSGWSQSGFDLHLLCRSAEEYRQQQNARHERRHDDVDDVEQMTPTKLDRKGDVREHLAG